MRGHSRWADWEKWLNINLACEFSTKKELIRTGDRCEMVWPCAIDFLPTPCMEKTRSSKESKELSSTSLGSFGQLPHDPFTKHLMEYGNLSQDCHSWLVFSITFPASTIPSNLWRAWATLTCKRWNSVKSTLSPAMSVAACVEEVAIQGKQNYITWKINEKIIENQP